MLYTGFASYVRWLTKTDSVTFPDADIVTVANPNIEFFAQEIAKLNEDYFGLTFYRDIIAGQREYSFPSEICNNIKRLEICIAGATDDDGNLLYTPADEFDLNLFKHGTDEQTIRGQFNNQKPAFEIYGNSLWIYSGEAIVAVTNGLKLRAIIYPQKLTTDDLATNVEMDVPKTSVSFGLKKQFHKLLALKTSIDYKQNRDKPIKLSREELQFDDLFEKAKESARGMNLDAAFTASVPYNDGVQY